MINTKFLFTLLSVVLFISITTKAALTMAYVSIADREFWPVEYNSAKIRQACIEVHGEEWVKENIILDRKYCSGSLFLSNANFMEISCKMADPKDLLALKAVIDHMAANNDTLYIGVKDEYFDKMYTNVYLNSKTSYRCPYSITSMYSVLNPIGHFLRVGEVTDIGEPDLTIAQFETFYLGNGCITDLNYINKYKEKCKKEEYMDLSYWHFDKKKVRQRDIDLYYDYTVACDKLLLKTHPKRIIPIDVDYNYSPNERIIYILDGNVFIEPD